MQRQFLLGEVAKILGRRPHQIAYLLTTRQVPEPERRIGNKRIFTEEDVVRLARHFRVSPNWIAIERTDGDSEPGPSESLALKPPFQVESTGETGHEVRDADGVLFCWTGDRARALVIAGLLESAVRG
jgi:hypothetical protein